MLMPL